MIKSRRGYGGTGVYVMPDLGDETHATVRSLMLGKPDEFIAQETLDFSSHMVFDEEAGQLDPRYIDLRVFAVQDGDGKVTCSRAGSRGGARGRAGSRTTRRRTMQADLGHGLEEGAVLASYLYASRYEYSAEVVQNDNQLRVQPVEGIGQTPLGDVVWTIPEAKQIAYRDRFGNRVLRVRVLDHHRRLVVCSAGTVALSSRRRMRGAGARCGAGVAGGGGVHVSVVAGGSGGRGGAGGGDRGRGGYAAVGGQRRDGSG